MSSELEEFIGLCTRVIVFRHGEIFDAFAGDDIEPARLLEAMFGQTSGRGAKLAAGADSGPAIVDSDPVPESEWEAPRKQHRPQRDAIGSLTSTPNAGSTTVRVQWTLGYLRKAHEDSLFGRLRAGAIEMKRMKIVELMTREGRSNGRTNCILRA